MRHAERKANKERQFLKELIDKMFELAGHDLKFEDVEGSLYCGLKISDSKFATNEEEKSTTNEA